MSRITVIIPAFRAGHTLERCLQAIAKQTLAPDEVIVVDDGSDDDSAVIAKRNGARVIQTAHAGASAARNAGAAQARGDLLFFCDADVVLVPAALATLAALLHTHPHASFAYSAFRQWNGQVMGGLPFTRDALMRQNFISTMALVRRSAFPGFDPHLHRFQDWDLWLTMVSRGGVGVGTDQVLFSVLVPGQISRGAWSRLRATWVVRRKHHLPMQLADVWLAFKEWVTGLV